MWWSWGFLSSGLLLGVFGSRVFASCLVELKAFLCVPPLLCFWICASSSFGSKFCCHSGPSHTAALLGEGALRRTESRVQIGPDLTAPGFCHYKVVSVFRATVTGKRSCCICISSQGATGRRISKPSAQSDLPKFTTCSLQMLHQY